jgi:Tfp pilus assembly protein PilX
MFRTKFDQNGFTLIASLMLLALLSGFAIGLLMMVNTEQRAGGNDLSNQYVYRATEGAIEKQSSDLAGMFQTVQAPSPAQICALSNNYPVTDTSITYPVYQIAPVSGCSAPLTTVWGQISAGSDAGLYAQIIPVTMSASAQRLTGETVSMSRTAEVALIPVFQFGVFSEKDVFFGSSPNLTFNGRIHTNMDLYLGVASGSTIVFGDKMSAYGNVIRNVMDNGLDATNSANNDNGTVLIPNANLGCAAGVANGTCISMAFGQGSVVGGHGSAQNSGWSGISQGTYNSYLIDGNNGLPGGTGATQLSLPFVQGTTQPQEIIRRPMPGESTTSVLGASRLANQAQIRVLLSDKEADLHMPDWNGDATQDIELVGAVPTVLASQLTAGGGWAQPGITVNGNVTNSYYFGEAWCGTVTAGTRACSKDTNFVQPPTFHGAAFPAYTSFPGSISEWPLIDGWLLVEVKWTTDGKWHGVTKEWLGLGFARGLEVPTIPGTNASTGAKCTSPAVNALGVNGCNWLADHTNAILYFQVTADRTGNNVINSSDYAYPANPGFAGPATQYNWYPINFYDAREGENWDVNPGTFAQGTGTPNGVMNAVDLDVGNLKAWLAGKTGTSGTKVDYVQQNGYVLYFSDRRGMQYNPAVSTTTLVGEYGFEDVINYTNSGVPNGTLEPANYNGVSPEDVNGNGVLDTYGVKTVGDAFGPTTQNDTDVLVPATPFAPGHRIGTFTLGRANRVTGARHALKLVDGSMGYLPQPPGAAAGVGGFTVGSENPVYIQGDYNSSAADPMWGGGTTEPAHAAAAIIADTVTMLSNNWEDAGSTSGPIYGSLYSPLVSNSPVVGQSAATTYYRVAIAAGKTIAFNNTTSNPTWAFGMDGGVHNFLRFLEDWSGQTLNYKGSLVSLYWNTYATGTFKCCNLVYHPPVRNYVFDPMFSQPQNLPPGTPMFRNVDQLTYRQSFTARTN